MTVVRNYVVPVVVAVVAANPAEAFARVNASAGSLQEAGIRKQVGGYAICYPVESMLHGPLAPQTFTARVPPISDPIIDEQSDWRYVAGGINLADLDEGPVPEHPPLPPMVCWPLEVPDR
jgi:hypothetical protein